ncbi:MAG: MFS transporter [Kofleriaceae bacterium]|nr:MFS transporter [Kofleriaceae bacterium]MCL4227905.1 MFS transporter [Myxococcales bacterium]
MAVVPRFAAWAELDRRIWTLALARAVNTVGLSLVMAFLGVYVVDERGYSAALFGAIALGANLAQSATNAWAGELSDRVGRRPIMVGALTVRAAVIAGLGVQVLLHAPLWSLALNFVASSALRGCFEPPASALVADIAQPHQRVAAFGLQRMGVNLGWAVGPAAGGLLAVVIPYGAVFFLAAAGLLIAAWTCRGLDDPRERGGGHQLERVRLRDAFAVALRQPPMVALLLGSFLFSLAHTQLFSVFAIYMTKGLGLAKDEVGLLYSLNGALVLVMQWPALGAIRRVGTHAALIGASLVFALGFGLIGLAEGLAGGAVAIAVITVAEVLFAPAHQAAAAESGNAARLGATFGLVGFTQMLGVAFGPLVGGALFDAIGHHHLAMWGAVSGVCLALAATFAIYARVAVSRSPGAELG